MNSSKCLCLICNKRIANLVRHMKIVHDVCLTYSAPATDMHSFAKLLAHFPLPLDRWTTLLENGKDMVRFLNNNCDLSPELYKILSEGLAIYKMKKSKLILLNENGETNDLGDNLLGCFKCIKENEGGTVIHKRNVLKRKKISLDKLAKYRKRSSEKKKLNDDVLNF